MILSISQKYWLTRYLIVLGGFWLFLEPIGLFYNNLQNLGWYGFIGLNILSLITTIYFFRPNKDISIILPESNTKINIQVSNILEQQGSIIVGTNDTFDTELGDIISPNSLQGQLLSITYQSNQTALDNDLDNSLSTISNELDSTKIFGKPNRYPIGTVAFIERNNNRYFLTAFNKILSTEKRVTTDISKFHTSLANCWKEIRNKGQHKDVHIPIIGTKFARTGLEHNIVIQLIIMSFIIANKQENISPSLTVHIHETDIDNIDFIALNYWIDSLVIKS
jgi:hypothetical protein